MQTIDEDRPLQDGADDEYGFAPISEKLAESIAKLFLSDGVVFGIEGPWGSAKTGFLNFLRTSLNRNDDVDVLSLAPWLIGDSRSLVASLISASWSVRIWQTPSTITADHLSGHRQQRHVAALPAPDQFGPSKGRAGICDPRCRCVAVLVGSKLRFARFKTLPG